MKILHITPHLGGGVGTVILGWMEKIFTARDRRHQFVSLDYVNQKALSTIKDLDTVLLPQGFDLPKNIYRLISKADIVLTHYWDHPMLADLFSKPLPDCRLIFWCHKYYPVPPDYLFYPDLFVLTANYAVFDRVPNIKRARAEDRTRFRVIRSTGDMSRFLEIKPKPHKGFNVGYVGTVDYKKLHRNFIPMCKEIAKAIPGVHFIIVGKSHINGLGSGISVSNDLFTYTGKVDDIAPYLAEFDIFGYPLRPDHYGTAEQSLGEAMAAGVVPVVMNNPAERTIINHRKDGLMASSEDKYVKFIKHLYDYPDTRAIMSDLARERSKKLYSHYAMIKSWNKVFDEMMTQPKKSRNPI